MLGSQEWDGSLLTTNLDMVIFLTQFITHSFIIEPGKAYFYHSFMRPHVLWFPTRWEPGRISSYQRSPVFSPRASTVHHHIIIIMVVLPITHEQRLITWTTCCFYGCFKCSFKSSSLGSEPALIMPSERRTWVGARLCVYDVSRGNLSSDSLSSSKGDIIQKADSVLFLF